MRPTNPIPAATRFAPLPCPAVLLVPSNQDAGNPRPKWLEPGTIVPLGEPLAVAGDGESEIPISPSDGIVGQSTTIRLTDGRHRHAIELTVPVAGVQTEVSAISGTALAQAVARVHMMTQADLADWTTRLSRLGVQADRWTSPNLSAQLSQALRRPIHTVVCNLLDSDPWLGVSRGIAMVWPDELITGMALLGRLTSARHTWALVDQADLDVTMSSLRESAAAISREVRIAPIENDYPQPNPTLLIFAATKRRLQPGHLPTEEGVLLLDAAAALAVGQAAIHGTVLSSVPVVVYDQARNTIHALTVPIGSKIKSIFDHLQLPMTGRQVFAGSPLRQLKVRSSDVIGHGELTLFVAPEQMPTGASPCIGCGWCVEGCPTHCRPAALLEASQRHDLSLAHANGLSACIECGLCTYVCPSRLPLLEGIRGLLRMESDLARRSGATGNDRSTV